MNNSKPPLPTDLKSRLVRFDELVACKTAFIDAKTPGSDQKENFCLIGGGVAESPDQVVHINIPHGFDIGGARQPKGCKNSHHSHDTEEVFFVHRGQWKVTWGEDGTDGEVVLNRGDTISIPTNLFRGFENVGPDDGFLYAILGLNADGTAGHVIWAPYVFEQAKEHGLVLLNDGRLIDTTLGLSVPDDCDVIQPTSDEQLKRFQRLSTEDIIACVARYNDTLETGGLSHQTSAREEAIIGAANPNEKIGAGKMSWKHGFQVRRLTLQAGESVAAHMRDEEEVVFVHDGHVELAVDSTPIEMSDGDLFSVPIGNMRSFKNLGESNAELIVVRRGDAPSSARFG